MYKLMRIDGEGKIVPVIDFSSLHLLKELSKLWALDPSSMEMYVEKEDCSTIVPLLDLEMIEKDADWP
jgi:hypothetical protein